MAKKKSFRRSRAFTLPMAVILPTINPIIEGNVPQFIMSGNFSGAFDSLMKRYAFKDMSYSIDTYSKIILGLAVHFIASKFGLNRALGRAGVPIIRI